jgi:hypothetical protein
MSPAWDLAPWLQAAAAVIQGGAAVVIVRLTRRLTTATEDYVKLTRDLADAARTQQQTYTAQQSADYARLVALVERLREQVAQLPVGPDAAQRLVGGDLWTDGDLTDLADLAAKESHSFKASEVIRHLRWLAGWMGEIKRQKDKPSGLGVDWGRIPWDEWAQRLKGAQAALGDLHKAVEE